MIEKGYISQLENYTLKELEQELTLLRSKQKMTLFEISNKVSIIQELARRDPFKEAIKEAIKGQNEPCSQKKII